VQNKFQSLYFNNLILKSIIHSPKINASSSAESPYQLEQPINRLKRVEVQEVINSLNPKKSSGYDLITGKILKELDIIAFSNT
jgi:hypothetical protein